MNDLKAKISNAQIAELLAREAGKSEGILARAYKKAARSAFLWPEHACDLLSNGRSLTELKGIGPFMAKRLRDWLDRSPLKITPPFLRRDFLTLADAKACLTEHPGWAARLRGDLQMHTHWSDGSGTILEMAAAAAERGYEYIAITDHSKGLKIAGGIDEQQLREQAEEISAVNASMRAEALRVEVLHSLELNLNPRGDGDMDPRSLSDLDCVLGCFHSSLR